MYKRIEFYRDYWGINRNISGINRNIRDINQSRYFLTNW